MKKDILLKFLERIDLHILVLLIIFFLLESSVVPILIEKTKAISGLDLSLRLKLAIGTLMFLIPQGIILTRVLKRKGFKFRITDKEYFFVNELLALFFVFLSCCMIEVMSVI